MLQFNLHICICSFFFGILKIICGLFFHRLLEIHGFQSLVILLICLSLIQSCNWVLRILSFYNANRIRVSCLAPCLMLLSFRGTCVYEDSGIKGIFFKDEVIRKHKVNIKSGILKYKRYIGWMFISQDFYFFFSK